MKNPLLIKFISLSLILSLFLVSCKKEVKRFIDPEDTNYSADIRFISKAINKNPDNAENYYKRANTFFFEDNYKEALLDIKVAIELSPENGYYYFKQGEFYMAGDTADAKSAEKSYLKAIELEPTLEEARMRYGVLLFAKQRYPETVEQMKKALEINPSNADALFFLGMVNKETGDTAKAIERFQETANTNSTYFNAYMQLALLYLQSDQDMALRYVDNALRIDDFSDEALYTKGLILQNKGEMELSKGFYKKTIESNPGHRLAYYNLAFIESQQNNLNQALVHLGRLIEVDPEYAVAYHFRGAIFMEFKNKEKALMDLEKALKLDPNNEEIKMDLDKLKM